MTTVVLLAAGLAIWQPAAGATRILFIGNSLTYANDLPGKVCALAQAAGRRAVCESIAEPDFSLEDHWNRGQAQKVIARGWDIVVLQQGPSALPESRVLLIDYVKRFDAEIRKAGGRTALYMVWPSRSRARDFPGVAQSYAAAASTVSGLLLPAGEAWRAAWLLDASLPLYAADGFHPSEMGTYLAALVVYRQIFGAAAPVQPAFGAGDRQAALLQRAAEQAIAQRAR